MIWGYRSSPKNPCLGLQETDVKINKPILVESYLEGKGAFWEASPMVSRAETSVMRKSRGKSLQKEEKAGKDTAEMEGEGG